VLTGFTARRLASIEASLKYLLIGAFATGFLLYGIAFVYGGAGTTKLNLIAGMLEQREAARHDALFYAGLALLTIGLAFKVGAVPFHQWVPDVYEGAPTAVTGFMAAATKVAAFAALLRTFPQGFAALHPFWGGGLALLAALTMIVGNLVALTQTNLKRLLAYSSIAHAGYILVGVVAGNPLGVEGVLYYGLTYALMTIGSFGVIIVLGERFREHLDLDEYRGLASTNPFPAWTLAILLFALAGFPILGGGGFVAKYYVFLAAFQAGYIWLVIVGVLCTLVSVYYYLRVVRLMVMEPAEQVIRSAPSPIARTALWISMVGVLLMGIWPQAFMDLARTAVAGLAW
jgi:NADH-quinone oxidoreductase subunit N